MADKKATEGQVKQSQKKLKILGIETSCDETSCSVIEGQRNKIKILSNIVSSQINLHIPYGGVVPEVAARAHIENIIPTLKASLAKAKTELKNIDVFAVTCGPGLLVSLLTGVNTAKALAYVYKKPIISIHHIEAHIYANFVYTSSKLKAQSLKLPRFPLLCLVVSGGHTNLILMKGHGVYKIIGQTLDDAAGEAFDKVGNLLDLPYPGGPSVSKTAQKGNPKAFNFPRAWLSNSLNFSFSGLKTAVLYKVKKLKTKNQKLKTKTVNDLAASFQEAVIEVLVEKTLKAARQYEVRFICLAGGVASNDELRKRLTNKLQATPYKLPFFVPPKNLCTDNAAMVATAGYFHALKKDFTPWQKINPHTNALV
jgi:N6-L-threonylcarbamoyladenine synthase